MNDPQVASVRLPVSPWPTMLNWDGPGLTFSMDTQTGGRDPVGRGTGQDFFGRPGWTPKKFAEFLASSEDLHVLQEQVICPTLAVLAGYLRSPIFVSRELTGYRELSFITVDGNLTYARFDGVEADLDRFRKVFLTEGLEAVLGLPGLTGARKTGHRSRRPLLGTRMYKMVPLLGE